MSGRHKKIFAFALSAMLASATALGVARFMLVGWWLEHCDPQRSRACGAALLAIEYWWVVLLAVFGVIALLAHLRTIDRLTPID
jgi:hypothetical protein